MKTNKTATPVFKEKKSFSIATLIVCFLVACGIWLYAQAINDDINTKTYSQLPVVVNQESLADFNASQAENGLSFHSLSVQYASVTIRGTNRELAKLDEKNIVLSVDAMSAIDGVATVKAYLITENANGEMTEIKDYDITPSLVTVNVSKIVECSVEVLPTVDIGGVLYELSLVEQEMSFEVIGVQQAVTDIAHAKLRLDMQNFAVSDVTQSQKIQIASVSFVNENDQELFNNLSPADGIRYQLPTVMVNLTPVNTEDMGNTGNMENNGKS